MWGITLRSPTLWVVGSLLTFGIFDHTPSNIEGEFPHHGADGDEFGDGPPAGGEGNHEGKRGGKQATSTYRYFCETCLCETRVNSQTERPRELTNRSAPPLQYVLTLFR